MVKDGDMLNIDDICELLDVPLLGVVPEDEQIIIAQKDRKSTRLNSSHPSSSRMPSSA